MIIHQFKKGSQNRTLVLFHGTGGDEKQLLSIAASIDPQANVLALRGHVIEYGSPRFFKRKSMDEFDEQSIKDEARALIDELRKFSKLYRFDFNQMNVIGYSNGANMASAMTFLYGKVFQKMILFHPMVPLRHVLVPNLRNMPIFIGAGQNDQMMPKHEVSELTQIYQSANADVEVFWTEYGHQISKEELEAAQKWY